MLFYTNLGIMKLFKTTNPAFAGFDFKFYLVLHYFLIFETSSSVTISSNLFPHELDM